MKTNNRRLLSALFAGLLAMVAIPMPSFGQGTLHSTGSGSAIYFAIGPAYNAANYTAFLNDMVNGMQNPSLSPIPLILPGTTISATNTFMFPGEVAGQDLISGADVWSSSTFTINDLIWIFSSPAWSFTNVFNGFSFGPGLIGANGNTLYTSGSADGVALTELWITPEDYSYLLSSGETIDQATTSFTSVFGSSFPITLTDGLNGTYNSGTITVATPEPISLALMGTGGIVLLIMRRRK
jgi:hypothetical protein